MQTLQTILRALRHRPFFWLWSGQSISRIGDYLYELALSWWVLEKTGSPEAMSLVLVLAFAPMLLFLLIGGVAVDRFPRVPIMLLSDILRGVLVTFVAVLAFAGSLEVWHVYIASLTFGLVDAFFQPAYAATVPDVTPTADLPSANALTNMSVQIARVVGPVAGAALVTAGGTPLAFAFNAASFFLSMLCLLPLLTLQLPKHSEPGATQPSLLHDLREGFATVLQSPFIWITILIAALTNVTLVGPYSIAIPYLVKDRFDGDVNVLGWLYAMFPIGYILGGLWVARQSRLRWRGWTTYVSILLAGLGMCVLGWQVPLWVLMAAALMNGAALQVDTLIWTTTLQEMVPADRLGRVSSIDSLGSFALLPIGLAATGWATARLGAAWVCLLGGALTMGAAVLGLAHPKVRELD